MKALSLSNFYKVAQCVALVAACSHSYAGAAPDKPLASVMKTWVLERAQRDGLISPKAEVTLLGPESAHPVCSNPNLDPLDVRNLQRLRFWVTCGSDQRVQVTARVRLSAEVVTAATEMPVGRVIADGDINLERQDIEGYAQPLSDPALAVGKSTRRAVRAGEVLQARMLAEALVVRRGDHLRIVARAGGIEVTAAGEALESGAQNAVIRVRNSSSRKEIRARVIDSSTVEPSELAGDAER